MTEAEARERCLAALGTIAGGRGIVNVDPARSIPATDPGEDSDTVDRGARNRQLTLANAETQRVLLAERIGVPVEKVKPCVALLGNISEGRRKEFCWCLVIELVRGGRGRGVNPWSRRLLRRKPMPATAFRR